MTVEFLSLAMAIGLGLEPRRVVVLFVVLVFPVVAGLLLGLLIMARHRMATPVSVGLCESVASELRAGGTLREAAAAALQSAGIRTSGDPGDLSLSELAAQCARVAPEIGPELETTFSAASTSGSATAELFDEIGAVAIAEAELNREIRMAASPAKAAALVFLAAPTVYLVWMLNSGSLLEVLSSPGQQVAGFLGLFLYLLGLVVAALVYVRAR